MGRHLEIPFAALSPEALQGVIEEFVTREGTDYGPRPVGLAAKVAQVRRQLAGGRAVLMFDTLERRCHIVPREQAAATACQKDETPGRPPADKPGPG